MMKSNPTPCTDWAQKLAARHPDDLSPSDRIALKEHVALCRACSEVHSAYQTMEAGIRSLLISKPTPVHSYQLSQPERETGPNPEFSLQSLISLVLSAFSSLMITICWSRFYQKLHTWVLIALAFFPQKIAYVSSDSRHMYAIRADNGFTLWQQKRYQKHGLVSTLPVRLSGICFVGAGTAYVSALDFCRYTAQA